MTEQSARPSTLPEFNPSGDDRVNIIKSSIEAIIRYLTDLQEGFVPQVNGPDASGVQNNPDPRCISIALRKLEEASMWAVKSLFVK